LATTGQVENLGDADAQPNPNSVTRFLELPTSRRTPRARKRNADPMVDFSKSIVFTSDAYIANVKEM